VRITNRQKLLTFYCLWPFNWTLRPGLIMPKASDDSLFSNGVCHRLMSMACSGMRLIKQQQRYCCKIPILYLRHTSASSNQPQLIVCVWPMSRVHSKTLTGEYVVETIWNSCGWLLDLSVCVFKWYNTGSWIVNTRHKNTRHQVSVYVYTLECLVINTLFDPAWELRLGVVHSNHLVKRYFVVKLCLQRKIPP